MATSFSANVKEAGREVLRRILLVLGHILGWILFDIEIHGKENLAEARRRPLIVIANHFSWFDPALLSIYLPFAPAFLVATETFQRKWMAPFIRLFDGISIFRGQVDREAFRKSHQVLAAGKALGIFPEGGMNPENQEKIARGEPIPELRGHASRRSGALAKARPGVALLAIQSQAFVLPVAMIGAELILDNIPRFRRTHITIIIGPVFGPLSVPEGVRGPERRAVIDELSHEMMRRIAALMPPARRGPYANLTD